MNLRRLVEKTKDVPDAPGLMERAQEGQDDEHRHERAGINGSHRGTVEKGLRGRARESGVHSVSLKFARRKNRRVCCALRITSRYISCRCAAALEKMHWGSFRTLMCLLCVFLRSYRWGTGLILYWKRAPRSGSSCIGKDCIYPSYAAELTIPCYASRARCRYSVVQFFARRPGKQRDGGSRDGDDYDDRTTRPV